MKGHYVYGNFLVITLLFVELLPNKCSVFLKKQEHNRSHIIEKSGLRPPSAPPLAAAFGRARPIFGRLRHRLWRQPSAPCLHCTQITAERGRSTQYRIKRRPPIKDGLSVLSVTAVQAPCDVIGMQRAFVAKTAKPFWARCPFFAVWQPPPKLSQPAQKSKGQARSAAAKQPLLFRAGCETAVQPRGGIVSDSPSQTPSGQAAKKFHGGGGQWAVCKQTASKA
jgi:hypothetical protein